MIICQYISMILYNSDHPGLRSRKTRFSQLSYKGYQNYKKVEPTILVLYYVIDSLVSDFRTYHVISLTGFNLVWFIWPELLRWDCETIGILY